MLGLPFAQEWLRGKGHGFKTQYGAISGAVGIMQLQKEGSALEGADNATTEAFFQQRMGQASSSLSNCGTILPQARADE